MTLAQLVVTIAIELTAIAVVLIVGAVILMEREQKHGNAKDAQVAYLCDKKRACGILTCRDCKHTTDVAHAKNFAREVDLYMEIEKDGEL